MIFKNYLVCPKCAEGQGKGLKTTWCKETTVPHIDHVIPEHIKKECLNCGFSWPERPMDNTEE
jgi:hypothetical protein